MMKCLTSHVSMTTPTRTTRIGSKKDLIERARRHATDLAATINVIRAAGATTLWGIAAELNRLNIPTAAGSGEWNSTQVRVVLRRLGHLLPANIYRLVVRRGPLSWEWELYHSGEPQPVRGQGNYKSRRLARAAGQMALGELQALEREQMLDQIGRRS
jgi:hypothetical protein